MEKYNYSISEEKIKDTLESWGYRLSDRGKYWQTSALYRGGDNPTALQVFKNSGVWRDFVQGTSPLPFSMLVELHLNTKDPEIISKYMSEGSDSRNKESTQDDRIVMEKIFKDSILEDLFPHYDYYNQKGIDSEHLEFLNGGLCTLGKMYQRFVFPIYNEHGQIHGLTGRDMTNSRDVKWKHEGRKNQWIYPYFLPEKEGASARSFIDKSSSVILVESIGDLLNLYQHGFKNCLVSFGLDISPKLLAHLSSFDNKTIIISFNNDYDKKTNRGARASVKNYLKLLNHFDFNQLKICLPVKSDFGEMNSDDFKDWSLKCDENFEDKCKYIIDFARKMQKNQELSKALSKNIKILEQNV